MNIPVLNIKMCLTVAFSRRGRWIPLRSTESNGGSYRLKLVSIMCLKRMPTVTFMIS